MAEDMVARIIRKIINKAAEEGIRWGIYETKYRQPLIGFLDASDKRFLTIKDQVNPKILSPNDILRGAETVVSFFFPFAPDIVDKNRRKEGDPDVSWLYAYAQTNVLISSTCEDIRDALSSLGIAVGWVEPTHNFDKSTLLSRWSHKSIGYMAGLGRFGLHQMIITPLGCAGRFGSLVLNYHLEPTEPLLAPEAGVCPALDGKVCNACIKACPVGAISSDGVDKHKCFDHLNEVNERYRLVVGDEVDACGKCATAACALKNFSLQEQRKSPPRALYEDH